MNQRPEHFSGPALSTSLSTAGSRPSCLLPQLVFLEQLDKETQPIILLQMLILFNESQLPPHAGTQSLLDMSPQDAGRTSALYTCPNNRLICPPCLHSHAYLLLLLTTHPNKCCHSFPGTKTGNEAMKPKYRKLVLGSNPMM